jgi:cell division protein FtsI (penicillin-binding protein 3)
MIKRPTKKKIKKNPMQMIFTRYMLIVAVFIVWIFAIGVRLVHLQVTQHEWLSEQAQDQRRNIKKTKQLRGTIYDRSERALAMSVKVKSLFADPTEIEDVEAAAKALAKVLKEKPANVLKTLKEAKEDNKRFVWLARKLDEDAVRKINEDLHDENVKKHDEPRFAGLHWREEQKRSYPYKTLAAHVIGFSNAEDVGSAGIEQSQEEHLHGAVIRSWQDRDRLGRIYEEEQIEREEPKDVVLTISNSIQYKTEQALEAGVKKSNAKSGSAIVLNPKTGEILAMANYPTFDPNRYTEFAPESFTNRAIHDIYAPGSVYKLITFGAAIDANAIDPNGMINLSGGYVEVGGRRFNDKHATKAMTYDSAFAVSSNAAAIKTALRLGKDGFYRYAQKFGFGQAVGVGLPAEEKGIVRPPSVWQGDSLASMSIGYEIGVTALQMATAYAAVANNGVRVQPHIIKETRYADGKVYSSTIAEKTPVVHPQTAQALRRMMREVVVKGTAKQAQLDGYSSAGKTGTAWKYNAKIKRVDASKYISSFIGFAPAENPEVVIAVVMDEPKSGGRNGGQVSAPVFREIAEQILPELNVIPDANIKQEFLTAENVPAESEEIPPFELNIEQSAVENIVQKTAENAPPKEAATENKSEKPKEAKIEVKKPVKTEIKPEKPKENQTKREKPAAASVPKTKPEEKDKTRKKDKT